MNIVQQEFYIHDKLEKLQRFVVRKAPLINEVLWSDGAIIIILTNKKAVLDTFWHIAMTLRIITSSTNDSKSFD